MRVNPRSGAIAFSPGAAGPLLRWDDYPAWRGQGRCAEADPEIFYPEKGGNPAPAKRVCAACEVRAECLEFALDHREMFGIWGGLSEESRRPLLAERDRARRDRARRELAA